MRLPALACLAVVPAIALGQVRIDEPFKSRVEIITITATVTDEEGRLITNLPSEAFELYEDGDPRRITQFTRERVPVALGLALDVSDSMFGQRLVDARAAVERFLFELLAPEDEYFVLTFNHLPRLVTSWTTDPAVVRQRLTGLQASGGTAVYDAVVSALPQFTRRHRQRAALVVISDGADTASDTAVRDVRAALLRSDAFVYAVAIDSPGAQPINTRVNPYALREVTDQSGGRTIVVKDTDGLRQATQRIAEELNSQYLIGFVSAIPADGEFHSLRLRVKDGRFRVRSRRGYVAVPLNRPATAGDAPPH